MANISINSSIKSENERLGVAIPGVYRLKLLKVSGAPKQVNQQETPAITFSFRLIETGEQYDHTEYHPRAEDTQAKIDNKLARIRHIMTKFLPEDKCVINGDEWQEVFEKIEAAFTANPGWESTIVVGKLIGTINNGRGYVKFPGYIGFLAVEHKQPAPVLSDKEKEANATYMDFVNNRESMSPDPLSLGTIAGDTPDGI